MNTKFKTISYWIFGIAFFIGLILFFGSLINLYSTHQLRGTKLDIPIAGNFGDFVGGFIGTFFTIATIIIVWLTYSDQKEEFKKQSFESSFFNLMNMLNDTINNMDLRIGGSHPFVAKGRDCFSHLAESCNAKIQNGKSLAISIETEYKDNESDLGPYLKMLKNIIKRIDEQDNNQFYISTFNSNISGYELVLLNYFMHSTLLTDKEKKLICKFGSLMDLDDKKIANDSKYDCNQNHSSQSSTPK